MATARKQVNMSGEETSRGDHKETPAEPSFPPKKSTIRNLFKNFPTPSLRSVRGHQQAHGVKGCGEEKIESGNEERVLSEGRQSIGLSDEKLDSENNSKMPDQRDEEGEEGGGGSAATIQPTFKSNSEVLELRDEEREESETAVIIQHNFDGNLKMSNLEEAGGESATASQHALGINAKLLDQGAGENTVTSQCSFDRNTNLSNQEEKEGEKGGGGAAEDTQHDFDNQENNNLPPAIQEDAQKPDQNFETNTTQDKVGKAIIHTFSFHLNDPQKQQDQHPDSSSESHPLTASSLNIEQAHLAASKPRTKTKKQKTLTSTKDGKDSDSSVSSRKRSSKSKTKIKSKFAPGSLEYIDENLCGRIFSGWVEERQWVERVGGYRDVIEVDEWELEMNHQLQAIISSIPGVQDGTRWINITPPDKNPYYCLWVLLQAPPTPGHYWYTITGIKLQPQFGLMISVKEIRSIHPYDGELATARRKRLKKKSQSASQNELESVSDVLQDWLDQLTSLRPTTVLSSITSTLTLSNIKETIRFLTVLLMTLVIGLVTLVRESHVVGLRFVREAGIFFHNATPFLQTLLGFFEKIVGGLYLLVAMVYRDFRRPSVPPPRFPQPPPPPLTPSSPRPSTGPRAIQYVSPERWVVKTQNNEFT